MNQRGRYIFYEPVGICAHCGKPLFTWDEVQAHVRCARKTYDERADYERKKALAERLFRKRQQNEGRGNE